MQQAWSLRWLILGCVALANAPDVDFIPGLLSGELNRLHHGYTHTLGWCLLVGVGVRCLGGGFGKHGGWTALVVIIACLCSHLVADYLCEDRSAPFGILLGWPFDTRWCLSPISIFGAMSKQTLGSVFSVENLGPALREAWIGGGMVALVVGWKSLGCGTPNPSDGSGGPVGSAES